MKVNLVMGDVAQFVSEHIAPNAARWDAGGAIDVAMIKELASAGLLGAAIPAGLGGSGYDQARFGRLCEEVGAACSSTRSLLTVQNMVGQTVARWGTERQCAEWVSPLSTGDVVAGFCLTEPGVGSDAGSVESRLTQRGEDVVLNGRKTWVTFGEIAGVFLVIARGLDGPTALLVPRDAAGIDVEPIRGQLGLRAGSLANVTFTDCRVPASHVVAKPGAGFTHVATTALDHGRFSVAWGCAGIVRDCVERSIRFASSRKQFGHAIIEVQLVRKMISDMYTGLIATRLICERAAEARDAKDPSYFERTLLAKYHASTAAASAAADAVQIHGARGVDPAYAVERHYRDAKIMQIIEGSDQMMQLTIADIAAREFS